MLMICLVMDSIGGNEDSISVHLLFEGLIGYEFKARFIDVQQKAK